MNARAVEAGFFFHADGQTDCHEEANNPISQFYEKAPSNSCMAVTN